MSRPAHTRAFAVVAIGAVLTFAMVAACSSDDWFGGRLAPCTGDVDCPAPWSCIDGYCGADWLAGDTGTDASGADTGVGPLDTGTGDTGTDATGQDTDVSEDDELWIRFGTRGSVTGLVNTQAECDLRSVRTDDARRAELPDIGPEPWGSAPIEDAPGFCGTESETLGWRLLNCERITRGLNPLRCDLRLTWTARGHSANMRDTGFFDHVDPDGNSPWDRMEINGIRSWNLVGENITTYPPPESAHLSWMESEGHRENILTPDFAWVGQGEAGGRSNVYTTQLFARYTSDR